MIIHNKTRDHSLIEKLSKFVLCISEQRLSQLSILIGNIVIEANERDGVVNEIKLRNFSPASVDNTDVNIQSSLSTTSLLGTAASIAQHPTSNNEG